MSTDKSDTIADKGCLYKCQRSV